MFPRTQTCGSLNWSETLKAYSSSPNGRICSCLSSTRSARRDERAHISPVTQRRVVLRLAFLIWPFKMLLGLRPLRTFRWPDSQNSMCRTRMANTSPRRSRRDERSHVNNFFPRPCVPELSHVDRLTFFTSACCNSNFREGLT